MVQDALGNGWFYYDYSYDVRSRYTSENWRPYATWNYYYQIVSNVNYILAEEENLKLKGDPAVVDNIMAQAYTMRAYTYFILIQTFQQTYIGHEQSPVFLFIQSQQFQRLKGKGEVLLRKCIHRLIPI